MTRDHPRLAARQKAEERVRAVSATPEAAQDAQKASAAALRPTHGTDTEAGGTRKACTSVP